MYKTLTAALAAVVVATSAQAGADYTLGRTCVEHVVMDAVTQATSELEPETNTEKVAAVAASGVALLLVQPLAADLTEKLSAVDDYWSFIEEQNDLNNSPEAEQALYECWKILKGEE